jgi:hypothetical protein
VKSQLPSTMVTWDPLDTTGWGDLATRMGLAVRNVDIDWLGGLVGWLIG